MRGLLRCSERMSIRKAKRPAALRKGARGMEARDLEPEVIGSSGKIRRLETRVRAAQLLERLADRYEKDGVRISIAGPMFSVAGHASLGVVLEVSPGAMSRESTRRAIKTLPGLVRDTLYWEPELIYRPSVIRRLFGKPRAVASRRRVRRVRKP